MPGIAVSAAFVLEVIDEPNLNSWDVYDIRGQSGI